MILHGDCLEQLKTLEDNSVDSIVTDPPYGLSFMGKKWDYDVPSKEIWTEALRVLKPGGHLLSFAGTRTYHRMAVNIEDAGFEIRDQIMWIYGSGFPKSTNVALRIDKESGASGHRGSIFNTAGQGIGLNKNKELRSDHPDYKKPEYKTDEAKQWDGWGTALKPANEPIVVARKPLEKGLTVAQNVLKWGTGALNIDGSRIGTDVISTHGGGDKYAGIKGNGNDGVGEYRSHVGRWPANVILDEEAAQVLDEQSGSLRARGNKTSKDHGGKYNATSYEFGGLESGFAGDSGGASRFFYVAKASKRERGEGNGHPTVKPLKLMEYLIKLVTPPQGTCLDPFMGSGSTGVAAKNLGFKFIGIEREKEYFEIAQKRIA